MVAISIDGTSLDCQTRPDLFSPKALDKGSEMLLQVVADLNYETALDLGCGWGAMGLWLAKHQPDSKVTLADSDLSAIKAAQLNAKANHIHNVEIVLSTSFDELTELAKHDLIVCHPPTHRGREIVESMIKHSAGRLTDNGVLALVVEARLKPWVLRSLKNSFKSVSIKSRSDKHVVLWAVKPQT